MSPTRVVLQFNQNIELTEDPDPAPFTLNGGLFGVGEASQESADTIRILYTGVGLPTSIDFTPPPAFILGDPSGVPAAAFDDFPLTEE